MEIAFGLFFVSLLGAVRGENEMLVTLDCNPGDARTFAYESESNLWGPIEQNIKLSAEVRVHCMGKVNEDKYPGNAIKYMVEVSKVEPRVVRDKDNSIGPLAAASHRRTKRGVESWLKGAWKTVKTFFVNLFTKGTVSGSTSSSGPEFTAKPAGYQCKSDRQSASGGEREGYPLRAKRSASVYMYDKMFDLPFEFIQLSNGRIAEIKFTDKETDDMVKNFKRHLTDTFATRLDATKGKVIEKSPLGEHKTRYHFETSTDASKPLLTSDIGLVKLIVGAFTSNTEDGSKAPKTVSIMRDIAEGDVMKFGGDKEMIHDPSQVDISAKQVQQISSEGHLMATVGKLSVSLLNSEPKFGGRQKRDAGDDLDHYMKVNTQYTMKMVPKKSKRSVDSEEELLKLKETETKLNFVGDSIVASSAPETGSRDRLESLKEKLAVLFQSSKSTDDVLNQLQTKDSPLFNSLLEVLDLEFDLNEDNKPTSISVAVRSSITMSSIERLCGTKEKLDLIKCHDVFVILSKAGSKESADFLFDSIDKQKSLEEKAEVLKLLTQINRPSDQLVVKLTNRFREERSDSFKGHFILAATNLAGQPSVSAKTESFVNGVLLLQLNQIKCDDNDILAIDVLEAIGNMGRSSLASRVISKRRECKSDSYLIASIHGVRKLTSDKVVQKWFFDLLSDPDINCVVKQEIVSTLKEASSSLTKQWKTKKSPEKWPKHGFNDIDEYLSESGLKSECLKGDIVRYLERKVSPKAKELLKNMDGLKQRSRRATVDDFWDDSRCKEWDAAKGRGKGQADSSPGVIVISDGQTKGSGREREELDSSVGYLKRRKCTAYKFFGPKQAQAAIRADIVNDLIESGDNPEYKLMAQFVVGSHFLGKDIDVGKMYVYHRRDSSRAYVNLFGRTLLDAARNNCDSTAGQPYRYSTFIPLYDFNMWIVQVSLGLRFVGEMALNPIKEGCSSRSSQGSPTEVFFSPDATVRAAGEASGKVLVIKSGLDIGGDFNYFSDLQFHPDPELCLTAFSGHRPMNVSIQSWYQFWDLGCREWMDRSIWKPKSLNWEVAERSRSPWIDNHCLLGTKKSVEVVKEVDP